MLEALEEEPETPVLLIHQSGWCDELEDGCPICEVEGVGSEPYEIAKEEELLKREQS